MDSNLVSALIIALGRAVQSLRRPARSGTKLMIGAASDLTRPRLELLSENALLRRSTSGLGATATIACSYSPGSD